MAKADREMRARALAVLAETLDVGKTVAQVPGLTRAALRAILLDAASDKPASRRSGKVKRVTIYTDGASRGNPGLAGAGVVLRSDDGRVLGRVARFLGEMTNNMAEYTALLIGLKEAAKTGAEEVEIRSDSELLVRQLSGRYKVKNEALQIMHGSAMDLLGTFKRWKAEHIRREKNKEADQLANNAIDDRD
ncbi:MAG: ribonuclease HI family protein [Myxococcota bacterium]